MDRVLKQLSKKERNILILRYGLDDGHYRGLDEVGTLYGICRERVRQIESHALRKLRHPNMFKPLKPFLEVS